jgi:hypothetical protein
LAVFSASRFGVRQSVAVRAGSTTISVATVRIVGIIDTNGKKTALISAAFAAAASKPDLLIRSLDCRAGPRYAGLFHARCRAKNFVAAWFSVREIAAVKLCPL